MKKNFAIALFVLAGTFANVAHAESQIADPCKGAILRMAVLSKEFYGDSSKVPDNRKREYGLTAACSHFNLLTIFAAGGNADKKEIGRLVAETKKYLALGNLELKDIGTTEKELKQLAKEAKRKPKRKRHIISLAHRN